MSDVHIRVCIVNDLKKNEEKSIILWFDWSTLLYFLFWYNNYLKTIIHIIVSEFVNNIHRTSRNQSC